MSLLKAVTHGMFLLYSPENSSQEMSVAVDDVSKMREKILAVEKSEKGAEQLLRYYLQMSAMDCKLPINENQVPSVERNSYDLEIS